MLKKTYTIYFSKKISYQDGKKYAVDGSWILRQLYRLQEQYSFKIIETEMRASDFCYVCIKCRPKYINTITHSFAMLGREGIKNISFERSFF